jgi:hypothetical protein
MHFRRNDKALGHLRRASPVSHKARDLGPEERQAKRDSLLNDADEFDTHDQEHYNGHSTDGHHTIPKEIQKRLPPSIRNHPDIKGRPGNPNIKDIPTSRHKEIHPRYNERFEEEIMKRGGYNNVTVQDVLDIRDQLVREFGL